MFTGKVILVTGGTGTIGRHAVEFFLQQQAAEVRIFSRDEYKQYELQKALAETKATFHIGDVRDTASVRAAMQNVDYVLHTAALKHVPAMEMSPMEAVKTNIVGSSNILEAAVACGVKKVICTSTDKAAYPISAMGLSKALMEKVILNQAILKSQKTTIACIRLGNVIGSRGSVVPALVEQTEKGDPITVTNEKMTRFFMSMEDVLQLIQYAFRYADKGEIICRKMDVLRIIDLAKAIGVLFGKSSEYPIRITGSRIGEKEYEQLFTEEECCRTHIDGDYYCCSAEKLKPDRIDLRTIHSATASPLSFPKLITKLRSIQYIKSIMSEHGTG